MYKHVFLQRHTEALDGKGIEDFNRILSNFGTKQALHIGKLLNSFIIKPQKIICSPAARTKETYAHISSIFDFEHTVEFHNELYNASIEDIKRVFHSIDQSIESIMIIGHNPNITSINTEFQLDHSSNLFRKACNHSIPGKLTALQIETDSWDNIFRAKASILLCEFPLID